MSAMEAVIGFARWRWQWCVGIALTTAALLGGYCAVSLGRADERRAVAALAVTALPAGTENLWNAYVDRRLAVAVQRGPSVVAVLADIDGFLGNTNDIPFETPFEVACTRNFGAVISFGSGGATVLTSIFGPTMVSPPAEQAPTLDINPRSVAALGLQKRLCDRVTMGVRTALAR